jgi:polyvinyl alcohol dehydrogenase (cytochrome)
MVRSGTYLLSVAMCASLACSAQVNVKQQSDLNSSAAPVPQSPAAADLFKSYCASCHVAYNAARAPWPETLKLMMQSTILTSLESGKMRPQGAHMSHEERVAVANYLGQPEAQQSASSDMCSLPSRPMANHPVWNGWGVDQSNSRFQTAALAGIDKAQIPRLRLKWAFGYAGAISSGGAPTIIGDRVFVAGGDGRIHSLDLHSGCIYWTYVPMAPSRTSITVSPDAKLAFFGDQQGRVYAVDAATGALVWKTELETHPFAMVTGAPKLDGERLYVPMSSAEEGGASDPKYACCTFRGSVSALNIRTGAVLWRTYTIASRAQKMSTKADGTALFGPSGVGVWGSPALDPVRHVLYIGTGDNYSDPGTANSDAIMALNLKNGRILWVKQLTAEDRWNIGCVVADKSNCPKDSGGDFDIGASPILLTLSSGKRLLIIGKKSGVAYGLDPDDHGKTVWSTRIGKGGILGGIEFGGAADNANVYLPVSDWDHGDPRVGGGMVALDNATGKKIWSTAAPAPACIGKPGCSAAQEAPATLIPGAVFSGSLDGHIRAYDVLDGKILWDFDTAQDFETVNLVKSHGGSINYAGTVVGGGMLFVTSGYSRYAGMPGNVLLAFSEDGK